MGMHSTALGGKREIPDKSCLNEDGLTGTGGGVREERSLLGVRDISPSRSSKFVSPSSSTGCARASSNLSPRRPWRIDIVSRRRRREEVKEAPATLPRKHEENPNHR